MKKTDLLIISSLRQNAREKLTNMSKKTRIPVSTLFDRIRMHEGKLIKKHTALIDFNKLGYNTRANIILKVKKTDREIDDLVYKLYEITDEERKIIEKQ